MNRSLWGRKSVVFSCALAAALAALLMFAVCGGDKDNPSGGSKFTLTVNKNPTAGGTVTLNPAGGSYDAGTTVTATVSAASGYTFTGWSGAATGTALSVSVIMDGNKTLTASFQSSSGGTKYCMWDNSPTNCWEIGGPYATGGTVSEAACVAEHGRVVTNCNDVLTNLVYCRWDDGCWPIENPNAEDPKNPGMTNLQVCETYGFKSNFSDCRDYVAPSVVYYCDWGGATPNCWKLQKPDDPHIGEDGQPSGMTYKEACTAWGLLVTCPANATHPGGGQCCQ